VPAHRNTVRIIAGKFRSRKINFPSLPDLRPTADRIRETLFNWLQDSVPNGTCLDLFAGSGALGFEALSRGATSVIFVERNLQAAKSIERNLTLLNIENAYCYKTSAEQYLKNIQDTEMKFEVIFLDPPFAEGGLDVYCKLLEECGCLDNESKIYLESPGQLKLESIPDSWNELKSNRAGEVYFYLFESRNN
jgi:16S rRNA (guanine966-N2)-methyltransferase